MRYILKILPWLLLAFIVAIFWIFPFNWFGKKSVNEEVITHHSILESVESLGKLELVKYNFKEITEISEKNSAYLGIFKVPDSKALLISSGEAVGCLDLQLLKEKDIRITEDTLFIMLPKPELCYYKLNLKESKVLSVQKSVYYKDDKQLIEKAYKLAEGQIKNAALTSGILEQTKENAKSMLKPFLSKVSGKQVQFVENINEEDFLLRR